MPVNAVIEYSEMLLDDAKEQGQENFIPDLLKIHVLGKKLLALVDESLDKTKIDTAATGKEMEEFGANLRHELRTPLNAIIGYSEMLLEDAVGHGSEGFISDLKKIRSAGKLFLSFIEEIASFTRSKHRGKDRASEPSDASAMVRSVMSDIPPLEEDLPSLETTVGPVCNERVVVPILPAENEAPNPRGIYAPPRANASVSSGSSRLAPPFLRPNAITACAGASQGSSP